MASETWSAILSGWPSVTDSEVKRNFSGAGKYFLRGMRIATRDGRQNPVGLLALWYQGRKARAKGSSGEGTKGAQQCNAGVGTGRGRRQGAGANQRIETARRRIRSTNPYERKNSAESEQPRTDRLVVHGPWADRGGQPDRRNCQPGPRAQFPSCLGTDFVAGADYPVAARAG